MKIDAHFHIGLNNYNTVESIINYLDKNKIEKIFLLSWDEYEPSIKTIYQNLSVENIWDAYLKYPDRIVPFFAPDPLRENSLELLTKYHNMGIKGFAELKSPIKWDNEKLKNILEYLNANRMPLIFHMEEGGKRRVPRTKGKLDLFLTKYSSPTKWKGLSFMLLSAVGYLSKRFKDRVKNSFEIKEHPGYLMDFILLEKVLDKYKDIRFIGHGPFFWKGIASDFDKKTETYPNGKISGKGIAYLLMERYKNLYADISGPSGYNAITRDQEFTKKMVVDLQDKILFGTDNFDYDFVGVIERSTFDNIIKDKIMGLNALKIIQND